MTPVPPALPPAQTCSNLFTWGTPLLRNCWQPGGWPSTGRSSCLYCRNNPGPSPTDQKAIYGSSERHVPPPDWTWYNHTRRRFSGDSTDYSVYDENMEQPTMYRRRFSDPTIKPIPGNELEPRPSKVYESRHLIIEKAPKPPKAEKPKEPVLKFPRYYEFAPPRPDPRFYNVGVFVPLASLPGQFKPTGYSRPAVYNQVYEYRPQSLPLSYF